ncbi:amidase [Litoribacter ruber]|uniref:amidase n=1 Tax=Litoribacter ruber TaxID=702568 RepID=UPI001BDB2134|nr:amidase [Litoribacter ruber]MBT0812098.1 amidase [Litoribacter ruber]
MKNKVITMVCVAGVGFLGLGFMLGKNYEKISTETISHAEHILGMSFSPAEKDSMIGNLERQLQSYEALRKYTLPNEVAPVMAFNPLPKDFSPSIDQQALDWNFERKSVLEINEIDIAFTPVSTLSTWVKNGDITSEKLTSIFLDRLKTHGDTLQLLITLMEDEALERAREMDREIQAGNYRGPLHGIPYGIKDLFAVKGTKTTWGATPFKDQEIDETATVVEKLDEAGGVLLAKFTLGALAMGDVWYGGVTKNPWNLEQGASGSSAGSAAAVSAGLIPYAIGTETLGSIVSPSTRNGVTGLRPTFGRVSRHGAMALSWTMDKVGPIGRTAEDNAIVLAAINGKDERDRSTIQAAFNYDAAKSIKDLKIGYFDKFFEKAHENDKRVLEDLRELGLELHPVDLKTSVDPSGMSIMLMAEGAAAFDELTRSGQDDLLVAQHKNAWPNLFRAARFIPAVEYIQASRQRAVLIEEMHELFSEYDVIITPTYGGNQLLITNLTGHPALCLPNGFGENGSPTSITFLANLFDEEKLIMLGKAYQEKTEWEEKRPPLFSEN